MIFHITTEREWQQAHSNGSYQAAALESEGFIHCSTKEQILKVANAFYTGQPNLVLLCIEPDVLQSPVKWEPPVHVNPNNPPPTADEELFPHIYGEINHEAVLHVIAFPPNTDGSFTLPESIQEME